MQVMLDWDTFRWSRITLRDRAGKSIRFSKFTCSQIPHCVLESRTEIRVEIGQRIEKSNLAARGVKFMWPEAYSEYLNGQNPECLDEEGHIHVHVQPH